MRMFHAAWILLCLAASAHAARADVIVEGTVEYWDEILGTYLPARHVTVEVERDWAWDDPEVETDDQGHYRAALPNPMWGTHDGVDIEVYAQTNGLSNVYSSMFDFYPYEVDSRSYDDVPPNTTLTIDLRFGKPPGAPGAKKNLNVHSWLGRGMVDEAKAFLVHQEMYRHYRQLKGRQWPDDAFGEKDVIVPAFGKVAYYNHITNNINLVTDDWTGLDWPPLTKFNNALVPFNAFRYTVRHEYSHAVHDEITVIAPIGLNMPSYHSPNMESNRWIAWTEGFADFLSLVTIGQAVHAWEFSRADAGGLPVLTGNHFAMEGEVTGFLWDLYDARGYEALRHPARQSADGLHNLPPALVRAQTFYDGLEDPTAAKVRQVASMPVFMGVQSLSGSVETLAQFIQRYVARFPAPHAVKAIALNRDLTALFPKNHPAVLTGSSTIRRWARTVTLDVVVLEDDPEDRPSVRLTLYQQMADGTVKALSGMTNRRLSTGWKGATCPVTAKATLEVGFKPGDVLWLEVNDDVLPRVYRFTIPMKDDGVVTAAVKNERLAGSRHRLSPGNVARADAPQPEDSATVPLTDGNVALARDREDFDAPLDEHWTLLGAARVERSKADRSLLVDGFGFGVFDAAGRDVDGVRFAYRHGEGVGDVLTALADASRRPSGYHLLFFADRVALVREAQGAQVELGSAALGLVPGSWHDVFVSRFGGEFRVVLDGIDVLRVVDPAPLPAGKIAFGSLVGTGFAYDDVVFFSRVDEGPAPAPRPPSVAPPSATPHRAAGVRKRQEIGALVRAARKELRAYGDLLRRRKRLDRALYRLASSRGVLPATVDLERVFPRRRAVVTIAKVELTGQARTAQGAYVQWRRATAQGQALATPLKTERKATVATYLVELVKRTELRRRAPVRVADLRQRLRAAAAGLGPGNAAAVARTRELIAGLVRALEVVEKDSELLAALEQQQAVLEALGR
ncbi:MAG: hypothetical protein ACC662_05970 [Planctomycetota bacterium]